MSKSILTSIISGVALATILTTSGMAKPSDEYEPGLGVKYEDISWDKANELLNTCYRFKPISASTEKAVMIICGDEYHITKKSSDYVPDYRDFLDMMKVVAWRKFGVECANGEAPEILSQTLLQTLKNTRNDVKITKVFSASMDYTDPYAEDILSGACLTSRGQSFIVLYGAGNSEGGDGIDGRIFEKIMGVSIYDKNGNAIANNVANITNSDATNTSAIDDKPHQTITPEQHQKALQRILDDGINTGAIPTKINRKDYDNVKKEYYLKIQYQYFLPSDERRGKGYEHDTNDYTITQDELNSIAKQIKDYYRSIQLKQCVIDKTNMFVDVCIKGSMYRQVVGSRDVENLNQKCECHSDIE